MPSLDAILISIVGTMFAALLGYVISIRREQMKEVHHSIQALDKSVNELKVIVATISIQVAPLWARVQAQISEDLHHPSERFQEMDRLLEQLDEASITSEGRARLKALLGERAEDTHPDIDQQQREKAVFMISVMDMVLAEKAIADAGGTAVTTLATIESKGALALAAPRNRKF